MKVIKTTGYFLLLVLCLAIGYVAGLWLPGSGLIGINSERFVKDVEYPKDGFFADPNHHGFKGIVKQGTECRRALRKGSAVYVDCRLVVNAEVLE